MDMWKAESGAERPKSIGFFLTWQDVPRICASIAVFCACLGFGSGISSLGVALPDIAGNLKVEETSLGILFTCRGLGVLIGALFSARLLEKERALSSHLMCCAAVFTSGGTLVAIGYLTIVRGVQLHDLYLLFMLQGACFGAIDSFSAVAIAEMWGQRSQPWMQMKNMMSGMGAVIAPLLLSAYGFPNSFVIIALLGFTSIIGVVAERAVSPFFHRSGGSRRGGVHLRAADARKSAKPPPDLPESHQEAQALESQVESQLEVEESGSDDRANNEDGESDVFLRVTADRALAVATLYEDDSDSDDILQAEEITTLEHSLEAIDSGQLYESRKWETLTGEILNQLNPANASTAYSSNIHSGDIKNNSNNNISMKPPASDDSTSEEHQQHEASVTSSSYSAPSSGSHGEETCSYQHGDVPSEFRHRRAVDPVVQCNSSRTANSVDVDSHLLMTGRPQLRTLAYAPQRIARKARKKAHFGVVLLPAQVRFVLVLFVFVQIGLLYSVGGWMSTYVTLTEATRGRDPLSMPVIHLGTFVSTLFFMSQTVASVISVPVSMMHSASAMMRCFLVVSLLGWLIMLLPLPHSTGFVISACFLGAGLSCMYPLAMTIVNDYGATMDSRSTVSLVMGACVGEAVAPIVVGNLMAQYGANAFPSYIAIAVAALFGTYAFVHYYMRHYLLSMHQSADIDATSADGSGGCDGINGGDLEEAPLLSRDSDGESLMGSMSRMLMLSENSPRAVVEQLVQMILLKNRAVPTMDSSLLPMSSGVKRRGSGSPAAGFSYGAVS